MRTSKMIRSLPMLPGGHSRFQTTLQEILSWLNAAERTTVEHFEDWVQTKYGVKQSTANIYVRVIGVLDFFRKTRSGEIEISRFGQMLLRANSDTVKMSTTSLLTGAYEGFHTILTLIAESPQPISLEMIAQRFEEHYPKWQSLSQFRERVLWMRALDLVEVVGPSEQFQVSRLGRIVALGHIDDQMNGADSLLTEAEMLNQKLLAFSTNGDNSRAFELVVRDSFRFLGFEAEHIGGAGNTDVLVTNRFNDFKAIIDTKARAKRLLQLDSYTLVEHRKKHNAAYVAVVAPDFASSGKVIQRAEADHIVLIPAWLLGECLLLHEKVAFSIEELKSLFETPGLITYIPEQILERCRWQDHIGELLTSIVCLLEEVGKSGVTFVLNEASLHSALVIRTGIPYTIDELRVALALLTHPVIEAVIVTEYDTLQLTMSQQTFASRLTNFNQLLDSLEI